jgi:hypothetical protein
VVQAAGYTASLTGGNVNEPSSLAGRGVHPDPAAVPDLAGSEPLNPRDRPAGRRPQVDTFFGAPRADVGVHVEIRETVEGVDPEEAMAWWTDFREGRVDHAFVRGAERRVHETGDAHVIEDRVRWLGLPVFTERVRAQERGNTVQLLGENTWATFRARYTFEHTFDPEGTEIRLAADIEGRGPLSWVDALSRPLVVRILGWDLSHHVDDMRRDLVGASSPT